MSAKWRWIFLFSAFLQITAVARVNTTSLMLSTDHIDGTKLMLFLCDIRSDFFSSSYWRSALKKHKWLNFHRASNWMPLNYGSKPLCIYYWQSTSVCEASVFLMSFSFFVLKDSGEQQYSSHLLFDLLWFALPCASVSFSLLLFWWLVFQM